MPTRSRPWPTRGFGCTTSSGRAGELEVAVSETLARWRPGSIELPDYYLVIDADTWAPTRRHWYLGVLHATAPARVVPAAASDAEAALARLGTRALVARSRRAARRYRPRGTRPDRNRYHRVAGRHVDELGTVGTERELGLPRGPVAVLGDDDLGLAAVVGLGVVDVVAVDECDHVGVLLETSPTHGGRPASDACPAGTRPGGSAGKAQRRGSRARGRGSSGHVRSPTPRPGGSPCGVWCSASSAGCSRRARARDHRDGRACVGTWRASP